MGYPSAIGVLWRVADRVAVRPEFTAARGSGESSSIDSIADTPTSSDNWQIGTGLSALFYLSRDAGFRTYLAPRMAYSKMNASGAAPGSILSTTSDGWAYATSGSFGAQYAFHRHFGVFGEVGVSYTSSRTQTSTVQSTGVVGVGGVVTSVNSVTFRSEIHSRSLGTRSGAGVIVYF